MGICKESVRSNRVFIETSTEIVKQNIETFYELSKWYRRDLKYFWKERNFLLQK